MFTHTLLRTTDITFVEVRCVVPATTYLWGIWDQWLSPRKRHLFPLCVCVCVFVCVRQELDILTPSTRKLSSPNTFPIAKTLQCSNSSTAIRSRYRCSKRYQKWKKIPSVYIGIYMVHTQRRLNSANVSCLHPPRSVFTPRFNMVCNFRSYLLRGFCQILLDWVCVCVVLRKEWSFCANCQLGEFGFSTFRVALSAENVWLRDIWLPWDVNVLTSLDSPVLPPSLSLSLSCVFVRSSFPSSVRLSEQWLKCVLTLVALLHGLGDVCSDWCCVILSEHIACVRKVQSLHSLLRFVHNVQRQGAAQEAAEYRTYLWEFILHDVSTVSVQTCIDLTYLRVHSAEKISVGQIWASLSSRIVEGVRDDGTSSGMWTTFVLCVFIYSEQLHLPFGKGQRNSLYLVAFAGDATANRPDCSMVWWVLIAGIFCSKTRWKASIERSQCLKRALGNACVYLQASIRASLVFQGRIPALLARYCSLESDCAEMPCWGWEGARAWGGGGGIPQEAMLPFHAISANSRSMSRTRLVSSFLPVNWLSVHVLRL